jgi:SulP family sulfate permease
LLISRTGPALLVLLGMGGVALFSLDTAWGLRVVGEFPSGLPGLTLPSLELPVLSALVPAALAIVLVGYVESVSVGRSLGARRRQAIEPNQELFALGAANVASGLTGGFPVTGGFSRSAVNFDAGANTGVASMVTAALIALVALFVAPLFAVLPHVVLGATVIVAVAGLIRPRELLRIGRFNRADGALMALTLLTVLGAGVEIGIAAGVAATIIVQLARSSRPHMAVVGRVPGTEHFRNVKRHRVITYPGVLLLRVDENLIFANTRHVEDRLLKEVAAAPDLRDVVLIFSAVNHVDATGLESLEGLIARLRMAGLRLHLAEVKGPVMDALSHVDFTTHLAPGRVFLTTHEAVQALHPPAAKAA